MADKADPDRAWFLKRMDECGLTQAQVAARMGKHASSFGRMINPEAEKPKNWTAGEVVAAADALQTTSVEILRRLGLERGAGLVPHGRVLKDGRVSYVVGDTVAVTLPGEYPISAALLIIDAAEGPLSSWDGAAVIYVPADTRGASADKVGKLCIIEAEGNANPILGEITPATGSKVNNIRVFQTGEIVKTRKILKASVVLGIHFRN